MAIYNLPVAWSRNIQGRTYSGTVSGLDLSPFISGENTIDATWGVVSSSGTTVNIYKGSSSYNPDATGVKPFGTDFFVVQDSNTTRVYLEENKTVWFESSLTYSKNLGVKVIPSTVQKIENRDYNGYFGVNQAGEYSSDWKMGSTVGFSLNGVTVAQPKNIAQNQGAIYKDIEITFSLPQGNIFDYEVKEGDIVKQSGKNVKLNKIIIKAGTLSSTNATLIIKSKLSFMGSVYEASPITTKLTITPLTVATISNFRTVGASLIVEEPIKFDWELLNSTQGTVNVCYMEFWQDGVKVYETSTSGGDYTLPASTLKRTSSLTVRYKNETSCSGYRVETGVQTLNVSGLVSVKPTVSNVTLNGLNRDYAIQATITAINADRYEIYSGTTKVAYGNTNVITIPQGTLAKGLNTLRVIGYKSTTGGLLQGEYTKAFDIIQDEPVIYSVEPSNINININELSTVSFSSNLYVTKWELFINGSYFANGTSERQIQINKNTFVKGANTLKVVVKYSPSYNLQDIRQVEKVATFNGYGTPKTPILDDVIVYNTGTPIFTWITGTQEGDAQTALEIEVGKDSKIVNSAVSSYKVIEPLNNNSTYTVKVRVKNKYELWSEWASKEFRTSFSSLPKPSLTLTAQKEDVLIVCTADLINNFNSMSIFRSTDKKEWIELANNLYYNDNIVDYFAQPNVETFYKVRVYDTNGGFNESDVKSIIINAVNYNLLDVEDLGTNKQLDFVSINFNRNFNTISKMFAGARKPVVYKGTTNYTTADMTVKVMNEDVNDLIDYIDRGKVFCYRDYKGKKMFIVVDIASINYINPFMQEIVLSLTEVNFSEKLYANKNTNMRLICLNGEYMLNGAIDMRGETEWQRPAIMSILNTNF